MDDNDENVAAYFGAFTSDQVKLRYWYLKKTEENLTVDQIKEYFQKYFFLQHHFMTCGNNGNQCIQLRIEEPIQNLLSQ